MAVHQAGPVLDEKWAAFIQTGVAIVASSRDARNTPVLMRAFGCRVSPNRQRLTLVFAASQAQPLLDVIRSTGTIAVVFTQPSTHVSLQIKGGEPALAAAR